MGSLWIKGLTSNPSRVYNHDTGTELQVINDSPSNNMNDTQVCLLVVYVLFQIELNPKGIEINVNLLLETCP